MGENIALTRPEQLKLFEPRFNQFDEPTKPKTPNAWFVQHYPEAYEKCGSPFLEVVEPLDQFTVQVLPISINLDFFASVLGGRRDLGHHVIYYECELAWYFKDSDQIFRPTTAEKLMNLYRGLLMKCCQDMPQSVHKLNLFHEWRSDKTAKAVVQRAKSILAADSSFFSPTSPHQRIKGQELQERVARRFVESLLTAEPGKVLLLADAYSVFLRLAKQQNLEPVKRSDFKAMVVPIVQEQFGVRLRNDLRIDERSGVRGWKNVKMVSG